MVGLTSEQGIRAAEGYLYHKYVDNEVAKLMDISLRTAQLELARSRGTIATPSKNQSQILNHILDNKPTGLVGKSQDAN